MLPSIAACRVQVRHCPRPLVAAAAQQQRCAQRLADQQPAAGPGLTGGLACSVAGQLALALSVTVVVETAGFAWHSNATELGVSYVLQPHGSKPHRWR